MTTYTIIDCFAGITQWHGEANDADAAWAAFREVIGGEDDACRREEYKIIEGVLEE